MTAPRPSLRLLLFLRSSFLCSRLLGRRFLRRTFSFGFRRIFRSDPGLLNLRLFLCNLWSRKLLTVKGNFSNPHSGIGLTVPGQLLILLFPLVMENNDLGAACLIDNLAGHM